MSTLFVSDRVYTLLDFVIGFLTAFVLRLLIACGYDLLFLSLYVFYMGVFTKGEENFHFYSVYSNSGKRIKKKKKKKLSSSLSSVADSILYIFIFFSSDFWFVVFNNIAQTERIQWKYRFSYFFDFMCDSGLNIITHSKQYGYNFHKAYTRKKKMKMKMKTTKLKRRRKKKTIARGDWMFIQMR